MRESESLRHNQALEAVNKARVAIADQETAPAEITKALVDARDTLEEISEADPFVSEIADLREALAGENNSGLSETDREKALGRLRQLDRDLRVELSSHTVTNCLFCEDSLEAVIGHGSVCTDCIQDHLGVGSGISLEQVEFSDTGDVSITSITHSENVITNSPGAQIDTENDTPDDQ